MHQGAFLKPKTHNLQPSFTLIELIVVMAIMAIVMTISVYQFRRGEVRQDLRSAADELKAAWEEMKIRSLAGVTIPSDTPLVDIHGGMTDVNPADYPTKAEGYGLLLFGPYRSQVYSGMFINLLNGQFTDNYVSIMACAIPQRSFFNNISPPYNPNFEQWDWVRGTCFSPLRQYAPVIPNNIVIDPNTIKIGSSGSLLINALILDYSQSWAPWLNYETCNDGGSFDISPSSFGAFFIATYPPQPTFYLNGYSGCKVLQFALQDISNPEVRLWVRFDLNTGAVRIYDSEPT